MMGILNTLGFAVRARYPGSRLVMNAAGELGEQCRTRIAELGIGDVVEFGQLQQRQLHHP